MAVPGPAWIAVLGLVVIGFAAAPVFPLLTLTTAERVGAAHADRTIGLQIGGAGLGGALIPAGIGVLLGVAGVEALGPTLVVLSLLLIGLYAASTRGACPGSGRCCLILPRATAAGGPPRRATRRSRCRRGPR